MHDKLMKVVPRQEENFLTEQGHAVHRAKVIGKSEKLELKSDKKKLCT